MTPVDKQRLKRQGLYSRAAQLIRGLPQDRGMVDQMIAAAKLKDSPEVRYHSQLPTGKTTRDELADFFESNLPRLKIEQYGESPNSLQKYELPRFSELRNKHNDARYNRGEDLTPDERVEFDRMWNRSAHAQGHMETEPEYESEDPEPKSPQYEDYKMPGMKNYRERLISLHKPYGSERESFQSSHWAGHPDVIAHLRLGDRVTPDGKRLLQVDELQSDWAQSGRDTGFNTGDAKAAYDAHVEDMRSRMRQALIDEGLPERVASPLYENAEPWHLAKYHGEEDKLNQLRDRVVDEAGKVPSGPYVGNTNHWTDLALKNVLREAAIGDYHGVVFTPGQAQADRYGLQKHVDAVLYDPKGKRLRATRGADTVLDEGGIEPEHVSSYIGKEAAQKLLSPDNSYRVGDTVHHSLVGDDLNVGGQGMKGYYDQRVPTNVMRLAKMHDPNAQFGEPVSMTGDNGEEYQGMHLPMSQEMKNSILDKGFPAMKRGGFIKPVQTGNVSRAIDIVSGKRNG